MSTKEELESEVQKLRSQIAEMESQLSARDALLQGSGEEGWLITTPNVGYTGVTAGIQFIGGRAFIPEKAPNANGLVMLLVGDFGYKASKMTAKEYKELGEPKAPEPTETEKLVKMMTAPGAM